MTTELENRVRDALRAVAASSPEEGAGDYIRVEKPDRRASRRRTLVSAIVAAFAVATIGGVALAIRASRTDPTPATVTPAEGTFVVDPLAERGSPGADLTVTGSGCPATSELVSAAQPVILVLTPPNGGNDFGPALVAGQVDAFMNQIYVPGEADTTAMPEQDGTFSATIQIPADAPPGGPYTVRALCTTLIERGQAPDGLDPASESRAQTSAGSLTVEP